MKVAAVNSWSEPLQIEQNLEGIRTLIRQLEDENVDYALFPELSVSGYINSAEMLNQYTPHYSKALLALLNLSVKTSVIFSVGLPIPDVNGWSMGQLTFAKGEIIGRHFKTHLSVYEKETFVSGSDLDLFECATFSIGMQLCLESHYPELSLAYQNKGANLLCFAFASPRETPNEKAERFGMYLKARAYDNACFVMACNSTGKTPSGKDYAGAAMIISPRGKILAQSKGYESNYCITDINKEDIQVIKNSTMSNFPAYRSTHLNLEFNA